MVKSDRDYNLNQLHSFKGGLKLRHHKNESLLNGLNQLAIPNKLFISLLLNKGNIAQPVVKVGDTVLKGQVLAKPDSPSGAYVHASSSGTITAIEPRATASPNAKTAPVIEITTDGLDQWIELSKHQEHEQLSQQQLLNSIHHAGLIGLGGAGFPTHLKYNPEAKPVDIIIVNGAECEPYITCDEQLMIDYSKQLILGTQLFLKAANANQAVIAIEDQVGGIKSKLKKHLHNLNITNIKVIKVPTIYPAGGEKQLIKVLTGLEVPSMGIPLDLGIVVQNVGTIKALYDYIVNGKPLVERIITVAGDSVAKSQNFRVLIGTPIIDLLNCAECDFNNTDRVIIGGPMMGFAMPHDQIGIDKTSNCILALSKDNTQLHGDSLPCIRCGECVNVCPAELLPQQLHWYINGGNLEKAREHHVFDCIECGACAWVCPSQIKLVDYYRFAKSELTYLDFKRKKSDEAQLRHEQREQRLLNMKAERMEKRKRTASRTKDPDKVKLDLQASLDRVKQQLKAKEKIKDSSND
jgi:electron transport complex protein RnfC